MIDTYLIRHDGNLLDRIFQTLDAHRCMFASNNNEHKFNLIHSRMFIFPLLYRRGSPDLSADLPGLTVDDHQILRKRLLIPLPLP